LSLSHFAFWCEDDPAQSAVRTSALAAHLAYVEAHLGRYAIAGPLLAGPDGEMTKSLFIVRAATLEDAWRLMHADPYVAGGLYRTITAHPFRPAAGQWIGGKTW
jgi:uncharacterized protein